MSKKRKPRVSGKRGQPPKIETWLNSIQKDEVAGIYQTFHDVLNRRDEYWAGIELLKWALGEGFEKVVKEVMDKGDKTANLEVFRPLKIRITLPPLKHFHVNTIDELKPELRRYLEYMLESQIEGLDLFESRLLEIDRRAAAIEELRELSREPFDSNEAVILLAAKASVFVARVLKKCNRRDLKKARITEEELQSVIEQIDEETPVPGYRSGRNKEPFEMFARGIFTCVKDEKVQAFFKDGVQKAADEIVSRWFYNVSHKSIEKARLAQKRLT